MLAATGWKTHWDHFTHVSALKERISTQVSIIPLSGVKSTITGPGCQLLSGSNQVKLQ